MSGAGSEKKQEQQPSALLEVGDIVGTHGLRGDLKVRPRSGDSTLLLDVDKVILSRPGGAPLTAAICRQVPHKGQVLLRFRDFESIALAETLIGSTVLLPESELPELGDDEYYWGALEGARVVDRRFGDLGRLLRMFTTAAHDTYVVEGPFGEILIPVVKQFVIAVDLDRHLIEVDLPDGLVPERE